MHTGPDHNPNHEMQAWTRNAVCQKSKMHSLICPDTECDHKPLQDYFRNNYDPAQGLKNFSQFKHNNRAPQVSNHAVRLKHTPNIKMTLNNSLVGSTTCLSEIVSVKLEDQLHVKVKVFYDTQSQHSMCSRGTHKLILLE